MRVGDAMDEGGNELQACRPVSTHKINWNFFNQVSVRCLLSHQYRSESIPAGSDLKTHALVDLGLVGLEFTIDRDRSNNETGHSVSILAT
jgi:hypothetical protein